MMYNIVEISAKTLVDDPTGEVKSTNHSTCARLLYSFGCLLSQELRYRAAIEAIVKERSEYTEESLAQVRAVLDSEQDKLQECIAGACQHMSASPPTQVTPFHAVARRWQTSRCSSPGGLVQAHSRGHRGLES